MKPLQRLGALVIVMVLSLGMSDYANAAKSNHAAEKRVIAFLHATVIPMDRERTLRDHTVVVADGKIIAIGATSRLKVPVEALSIDATGRYLIFHISFSLRAFVTFEKVTATEGCLRSSSSPAWLRNGATSFS